MLLLRVLKNTYELFDATDVVRQAKSSVRNVAAYALGTRMLDSTGVRLDDTPVFIGTAFSPSADGATANVSLGAGIALRYDTAEADIWLGEVEVIFSETADSIALSTNNDVSGDDRIDLISLRPVEVEEDVETRWFKDPTTLTLYQQDSPQRVRLDYEIVVTLGAPAPVPVAPATPAGTYPVAEVLRPNGQVNVNAVDVTDVRNLDRLHSGTVDAAAGLIARAGGVLFGDPDGAHYKIERDSATAPTRLRVVNQNGPLQDLQVQDLLTGGGNSKVVTDYLWSNSDGGPGGEGLFEFKNSDNTEYALLLGRNTPFAHCNFGWNDPGGALADNAAADVLGSAYNVSSVVWKVVGSDLYALVTLTAALPTTTGAIVQVTAGGVLDGSGNPSPFLNAQAIVASTTTIHVLFSNAAGALIEPTTAGGTPRTSISVYAGDA